MPAFKHFTAGVLIAFLSQNIVAFPTPDYTPTQTDVRVARDELAESIEAPLYDYDGSENLAKRAETDTTIEMIEAPLYDGEGNIAERADPEDEPSPNDDADILEQDDGEDYSDSKNATIVGDSSNTPDLAKRGESAETVGQCAKRLQPKWPKTKLTKEQTKQCVPGLKRRDEMKADQNALKSTDGKYELDFDNCGPKKILKKFIDAEDFNRISDRVCKKMVEDPENKGNKNFFKMDSILQGAELGITGRKKIAQTVHKNYGLNVGLGLVNYAITATPEGKELAFQLCKQTIKKISTDCVVGLAGFGTAHQVQRAASATWIETKSRGKAILFDYTFWN